MKKATLFTFAAAAAALLAGTSAAQAVVSAATPSLVTPGDTFSFDVSGFNSAGTTGFLLTPDETATFGATTTYTAAGINGQNITITSGETIGGTSTTDTFTVSTPTNFLTTTTVNGTTITQLQFDLGDANSGSNTVSLVLPINTYTATGTSLYSGGSIPLTPTVTLGTGNTSYSAVEGVNAGTNAISAFTVHSFTFSITYTQAIPEPSTYAAAGLGALALGLVFLRRNRRQTGGLI